MIKISDHYILRCLHGRNYLIPVGPEIAAGSGCIELNECGAVIWDLIRSGVPENRLKEMVKEHCHIAEDAEGALEEDISEFIYRLVRIGALLEEESAFPVKPGRNFCFAGLTVAFTGNTSCLDDSLNGFSCEETENVTQHWILRPLLFMPDFSGEVILNHEKLAVFSCENCYILMLPQNEHLRMIRIAADGGVAEFYYDYLVTEEAKKELFYGMRHAFFIAAQNHGVFALHSASILYKGKAWLFSGKSGTGKSTHTALWNRLYHTRPINGDINLLGMEQGRVVVYGTPWCGTSGIYDTEAYELGGIVLLRQSPENTVVKLPEGLCQLLLFQRFISPTWFSWQVDQCLAFADKILTCVPVCRLLCNMQPEAAQVMKAYIDATGDCT